MKRFVKAVLAIVIAVAMMLQMASISLAETASSIEISGHINTDEPVAQYHIYYDANGGTGSYEGGYVSAECSYVVCSLSETGISRDSYTFTGWNTASSGSAISYNPGDTIKLNNDIILYAQWKKDVQQTNKDIVKPGDSGKTSSGSMADASKTGDTSSVSMWENLLCVALSAIVFLLWTAYYGKRYKVQKS